MTSVVLLESGKDLGPHWVNRSDCYGIPGLHTSKKRSEMNSQLNKDFDPSEYLQDIPSQGHEIRYDHGTNGPSLTIDGQAQPATGLINHLFHPPIYNTGPTYSHEGNAYPSHLFPSIDDKSRLGSNNSPTTGITQTPRTSSIITHPPPSLIGSGTRVQYSNTIPLQRRSGEHHPSSSPSSFPTTLRHNHNPLSPPAPPPPLPPPSTSLAGFGNPARMSTAQQFPAKPQASGPPLSPAVTLGTLEYTRAGTHQPAPIDIEIQGNIDKGFFQCEGEWTCYRRNYFSCICSFSLEPFYAKEDMQWSSNGSQPCPVSGFAMSISAVVAENENHNIELVQHTPKRDKGPVSKPDKIPLQPKPPNHHPHLGFYTSDAVMGGPSRLGFGGGDGYAPGHSAAECQTEYNFERIQFKQATANNGKRRAQQQYYHLLIELFADLGGPTQDNYVRIAYSKSEKMIVRGRSPGHYQSERRRSASSGPGGSANRSMGGFPNAMMGQDFNAGNPMMGGGAAGGAFGGGFDARGMHAFPPGTRHHQDLPLDNMMPSDETKAIDSDTRGYLYYPGNIQDDHQQHLHHHHHQQQHQHRGPMDSRGSVDMFAHHRNGHGHDGTMSHMAGSFDSPQDRVKREPENTMLPRIFGQSPRSQRCSPFSGKSSSEGYYPAMNPQTGINIGGNLT